jgi:hypothetical protein
MPLVLERVCSERSKVTGSGFCSISHVSRSRLHKA